MLIKKSLVSGVLGFLALLLSVSISAQKQEELKPEFSPMPSKAIIIANEDGIAIDGYDPVAYFDEGTAVKGLATHSCEYLNKTWHFSSAENRDKFLSNPDKFSPQYGGYCAHSLSKNKLIESDPESFSIRDDKLYLYTNKRLAKKDQESEKTVFELNKTKRDNNWLTFQSDF